MAIEIRELVIKVKIEEPQKRSSIDQVDMEKMKYSILKECKKEIKRELKRTKER